MSNVSLDVNVMAMIMIITLTLSFLVALNFILLYFSCNKISKKKSTEKSQIIENIITRKVIVPKVTAHLPSAQLAATGS